ncbi:maleylpyruvate isomerase family mycothiol-dependent enzyme [Micromonospora okii]|uniref:maleylpyruvate isomerase family mycothiol-dependent enzyme n=1 Tax=Micromonospora okii TaxID=1182970 RepID=UPI001E2C03B0|nr:maleylpyruvate isomerase family mycothiol-dependent enzyme [Micromonospora okii]
MSRLGHEDLCARLVAQTDLLAAHLAGADLTTPVPSCPGWNVGQLGRHLGGGQRWAESIVRERPAGPPPDDFFRDLTPYAREDPAVLGPWLAEGARGLAGALSAAGPDDSIWTPLPPDAGTGPGALGVGSTFWGRRFTHETLVHRADAALALGVEFVVDAPVALDAVDEWMALGSLPVMLDFHPRQRELLGPGRTVHLHATDVPGAAAEWLVDLTGEVITWRRSHEKAAVAVRGPLTELLLVVYRRRPVTAGTVEVVGDGGLLDFWLDRVAFG